MLREQVQFFANYIERETGIIYSDVNLYQLQSRLEEIIKTEQLNSIEALQSYISSNHQLYRQKLLDLATNNETLFFRDPSFFAAISEYVVKEILPHKPTEIKFWSAASSTGQEAVSLAITMDELSRRVALPPYSILATDICDRALNKGRQGFYTEFEVNRGLSDERKHRYFSPVPDGWKVKSEIHSRIRFGQNNLIKPSVMESFHLILCRNVLIYQKIDSKKEVVNFLLNRLTPQGALLLGVGETLLGIVDNVSPHLVGSVGFYLSPSRSSKST